MRVKLKPKHLLSMMRVDFKFYLITDRAASAPRPMQEVLAQAVAAGVRAIQLREKDLSAKQLYQLALTLRGQLHGTACKLIINDRLEVASCTDAEGLHLTAHSLPTAIARRCMPADKLIGVSTHSLTEVLQAEATGADFVLFGPIFETRSKLAYGAPQGLENLSEVVRRANLPVFAIGGISPARAQICVDHGAAGVAAISSVLAAPDVPEVLADYENALGGL